MTPSQRKTKGKGFETKIADIIHKFLLVNVERYKELAEETDLKPTRDFSSGTFLESKGDIELSIAKKYFPISVECKFWKILDLTLNTLLTGKIKVLTSIWNNQVVPNAKKAGLQPLLVFKGNRTDIFVFYQDEYVLPKSYYIKVDKYVITTFEIFLNEIFKLYLNKPIKEEICN